MIPLDRKATHTPLPTRRRDPHRRPTEAGLQRLAPPRPTVHPPRALDLEVPGHPLQKKLHQRRRTQGTDHSLRARAPPKN